MTAMRDIHDPAAGQGRRPERPRSEPEIIPPDGFGAQGDGQARVFIYVDQDGTEQRVHVATPSPVAIILILLVIGLIAAVVFAVILGALVFLIPIVAVALASLVAYLYARGLWARWRGR